MRYESPLVEGVLLRRYKRFLADVVLPNGEHTTAHIANTGKMTNCLEPNARCRLRRSDNPKRKLAWSVEQVAVGDRWILVNTARPNTVVGEALRAGHIPGLVADEVRAEAAFPEGGRADFLLDGRTWVEVKNVTLLEGDVLFFPDTVSARATEHLHKLMAAVSRGDRAVLVLHVGTEGGREVRPAAHLDPVFAETVRDAVAAGVEVVAYRAVFDDLEAVLGPPVPVFTSPGR